MLCSCGLPREQATKKVSMICLNCDSQEFTVKQDAVIEQEFRGEVLSVTTPAMACVHCGWTTVAFDQLDELRRRTADAYREKHNLLTSRQIKGYRNLLKMSQPTFATFLGVGVASVKRWETWLVQDRVYDDRIRSKCKEALEQLQASSADVWMCVAHHGSTEVHGIIIHAAQPQPIMASRWNVSFDELQEKSQQMLPFSQPPPLGRSPPERDPAAFSLSAPYDVGR